MNLIPNMLPEALVRALGWTLLHSLWQTAFVALLLGLLLVLLHRHTARLRYMVAGGAMLAQLLLSAGTLAYCYARAVAPVIPASAGKTSFLSISAANPAAAPLRLNFWQDPAGAAQVYFDQHLPLLVTLWLLGLLLMVLRFTGGVAYTQRLRHYKTTPLPLAWQNRLQALSQRIGLSRPVRLVESALVHVPMAIGFARPVILLPIGAVAGLSPHQVEAILAHELAHILRKDYLLNLLQSVMDLLFFYHPAMWWMSGVVRAERENCCDDIAVGICGNTLIYARALAELEAMRLPAAPAMAMAFSGRRGSLLVRIKRLLGQQSLRPTFSEGFLAALVLVIGLLGLSFGAMAGMHTTVVKTDEGHILELPAVPAPDSIRNVNRVASEEKNAAENMIPANKATNAFVYTVQDSAGRQQDVVIIKNKKGKVTDLYVNGKRIPDKDIPKYNALVEQRLSVINHAPKASAAEVKRSIAAAHAAAARAGQGTFTFNYNYRFNADSLVIPPVPPMPPMPPMAPMPPLPPVPPMPSLEGDTPASKKEQKAYEAAMKEYEKEMKKYEKEVSEIYKNSGIDEQHIQQQIERRQHILNNRVEQVQHRQEMMAARQEAQVHRREEMAARQAELARSREGMAKRQEEMAVRREEMARQREVQAERRRQLKEELVKDGLIQEDAKSLSIQLNDSGFYVNGKKQPEEVYEKYKKLMQTEKGKSGNFNLQYNEN
ncbi:M48 family metalloprotease [Pontibacter sp. 172403-2]|uniref:M56 family metallopeptidase n=1 Tax=Pontibacter rufus TaxID=2791028 RepID=UPI0018AFB283|nr:M56 family metallopeptidase [Pontibacter sp. 172403-2]MBF9252968.1 M48 family metalloprotease [Pontibacter sp. 172403-2]